MHLQFISNNTETVCNQRIMVYALSSFPLSLPPSDDRFILKQIKSVEISSFEQIAPLYFEHVTKALEDGVSWAILTHLQTSYIAITQIL